MTDPLDRFRDLDALLAALCDHTAEPQDIKRIESLAHDDEGINHVLDYLHLDGLLRWEFGAGVEKNDSDAGEKPYGEPAAVDSPEADARPIIILTTDATRAPFFSLQSPLALGLVSYSAALLIVGVALLGAWIHKIDRGGGSSIASNENSRRSTTTGEESPHDRPAPVFVGRVTGIAGAKWSDEPNYIAPIGVRVALGRTYKLKSGLMEITYDSGAKVILQGPCSYEVDSTAGGYLALGKLTAKVERGEGGEERGENRRMKDEGGRPNADSLATSHQPLATNPSPLSPLPSPLFTVRTPTAIVTDLGTEFGVEVNEDGDTTSHVFVGSVRVQASDGTGSAQGNLATASTGVVLRANESARLKKDAASGESRIVTGAESVAPPKFARRMREPPKRLDMLDIVAGGDGTGNRRERGIDPTTGRQDTWPLADTRKSNNDYHTVPWNRFIDGVFVPYIPTVKTPIVQIDSAGHIYKDFCAEKIIGGRHIINKPNGKTIGGIWVRAAEIDSRDSLSNTSCWIYNIDDDRQYTPAGRGLLGMHANAGITFDLEAVRKAFEEVRPTRFHATAGLAKGPKKYEDAVGSADLWIFIDGRLVWNRICVRNVDGPLDVDVALGPNNRFLTVVSTQRLDGNAYDWLVLGDPVLETTPIESK